MVSIPCFQTQLPRFKSKHAEIFFEEKFVDVAEVNEWRCFEESEQWLENVDRTHLVLASGKWQVASWCYKTSERSSVRVYFVIISEKPGVRKHSFV